MQINGGGDASAGKEVRVAKTLRLLKLGKLLRVARLMRIIERYEEYLRTVWNLMGGWILSIAIFFLAHVRSWSCITTRQACRWFQTRRLCTGFLHRLCGDFCACVFLRLRIFVCRR